jgi:hypothetical protein
MQQKKRGLTGVRDLSWERRVACVSDLRLLELARFRLGELGDSRDSNGLFALVPFVVRLEEGPSSAAGDRVLAGSSFLGVVLLFRPRQRMSFLHNG